MPTTSKGRLTTNSAYTSQDDAKAITANTTESQMLIQLFLYGRSRAKRRDTTTQDTITSPEIYWRILSPCITSDNNITRKMRYIQSNKVTIVSGSLSSILVVAIKGVSKCMQCMPSHSTAAETPLKGSGWIQQQNQCREDYKYTQHTDRKEGKWEVWGTEVFYWSIEHHSRTNPLSRGIIEVWVCQQLVRYKQYLGVRKE